MDPVTRTLDEWYYSINKIYLDRNYYRDAESIFTHLCEIVGGLSLLATNKSKPGVDTERHLAKALAWWLSLCGKMRIRSVEAMIWAKFPGVCPYCQEMPHNSTRCDEIKEQNLLPDWQALRERGLEHVDECPKSLGSWLRMFTRLYPLSQTESYEYVFTRFSEELGELAEATRLFQVAPGYFFSEASDFFAWLVHLQAIYYRRQKILGRKAEERASLNMWEVYPDICPDCGNRLCSCPPVLRKTVGRISHDMPALALGSEATTALLSFEEAMEVFELSSRRIVLGDQELSVDSSLVRDIHSLVVDLRTMFLEHEGVAEESSLRLLDTLAQVEQLAEAERATQESIQSLASEIASLPVERRKPLVSYLRDLGTNVVAGALVAYVQVLIQGKSV